MNRNSKTKIQNNMSLKRTSVILLTDLHRNTEAWGSLKKACRHHPELVYNTVTKLSLPASCAGWYIQRVTFNQVNEQSDES